jgi:UDP-glucose 4-epimerase
MHILVTGGAGFIGSNLCDYLVNNGFEVSVVDDLSSGNIENLSLVIKKIAFYNEKIETFDFSKLSKLDSVIHLAAQVSVQKSISNFGQSSTANLMGSINVIDYCRKTMTPLIYASSAALYGNLKLCNDLSPDIDLLSPYASDKYMLEIYAKTAYKLYELPSIGLRLFNVYGPRQDPNNPYSGVISIFIDRLLRGKIITINGGHQTRDFIYVEDVVKAIYQSVVLLKTNIVCEHINILTGKSISIDELATILISKISSSFKKEYSTLQSGDPEGSPGTTKKMEDLLKVNLNKMESIDNGLSKTFNFISK